MVGFLTPYDPEPGYAICGDSFDRDVTVTGELPNQDGYGSDLRRILARFGERPSGDWASRNSQVERLFVDAIDRADQRVTSTVQELAPDLTGEEQAAVAKLIARARQNLEWVDQVYRYWAGDAAYPGTNSTLPVDPATDWPSEWPLTASDNPAEWVPECAGAEPGTWVNDRELVANQMQTVRRYYCPDALMRNRRQKDRKAIAKRLLEAMRALRCAEYSAHRRVLWREAKKRWDEENHGFGFAPGVGAGNDDPEVSPWGAVPWGIAQQPLGPIDPPVPGGHEPIEPLPPIPEPGEDEDDDRGLFPMPPSEPPPDEPPPDEPPPDAPPLPGPDATPTPTTTPDAGLAPQLPPAATSPWVLVTAVFVGAALLYDMRKLGYKLG